MKSPRPIWSSVGHPLVTLAAVVCIFVAAFFLLGADSAAGSGHSRLKQILGVATPDLQERSEDLLQALKAQMEDLREENAFQESQIKRLRSMVGSISCKVQKIGPTGGYCLEVGQPSPGLNMVDEPMVRILTDELFDGKKVLDMGSGLGNYGKWFKENAPAVSWEGLDGAENIEEVTDGHVHYADLTEDLRRPKSVDWVISFEVGEHIPKQFTDLFVDNLCQTAREGVVLSWGRPGQPGHFHINLLSFEDVEALFVKRGMVPDREMGERLRQAATVTWFQTNTQVFRWADSRSSKERHI